MVRSPRRTALGLSALLVVAAPGAAHAIDVAPPAPAPATTAQPAPSATAQPAPSATAPPAPSSSTRPEAPPATPTVEGPGGGSAMLPFGIEGLQQALDAIVAPNIPGSAVGAVAEVRGAMGTWTSSSGWADLETGARAESTDQFRAASNTKPMVSVLALQEVEAGRWTLQTTVDEVLPGLLGDHGTVTLAQLLSHTSGLPDFDAAYAERATDIPALFAIISEPRTNKELVATALTQPWLFPPGTKFSYSNTNYVVVGMMLQKATGQKLRDLLSTRVFAPTGMRDTFYAASPTWPARHLTEYAVADKPYPLNTFDPTLFGPAGAVTTTARDLTLFYRALITGKLLKPATLQTMATPPLKGDTYGLGLLYAGDACPGPDGRQGVVVGHTGASFGTLSFAFTSPDGVRQVTLAFNGRDYLQDSQKFNDFLVAALAATCTTPFAAPLVPGPAPTAGATAGTSAHDGAFPVPDVVGVPLPRR